MSSSSSTWLRPMGISWLIGGTTLFTVNTIAGVLILVTMQRRNITFLLIGAMITVDAIYGLAQMSSGIYSLQIDSNENASLQVPRFTCAVLPKNLLLLFTGPVIALLPWSLSVERLLAVFWPVKYRISGTRISYCLISMSLAIGVAWTIGTLVDNFLSTEKVDISCGLQPVLGSINRKILSFCRIIFTLVDVITYIPIIIHMRKKIDIVQVKATLNHGGGNLAKATKQQLLARKLNAMAALNAVNTFFLFNIPDVYLFIYGSSNGLETLIFTAMLACRGIVSTLIFVIGNRDLRNRIWLKFRYLSSTSNITMFGATVVQQREQHVTSTQFSPRTITKISHSTSPRISPR